VLVGSPAYMSPEQARGEDVDRSADLWAICVVLYELITGTLPFNGDNYNQLLWSIAHDEPVPTTTQFGGDAKLWAILVRGFRKQRAGRWESMRDLGEELARWLHDQSIREDIVGSSLQTTWLDRRDADTELFEPDSLPPERGPDSPDSRPRRGEEAIPTLPGSFAGESYKPERQRRVRRQVALGAIAGGGLLALVAGLWITGRSPTKESSAAPATTERSGASHLRSADGPVVAPVSDDERAADTSVAPLEENVAGKDEIPADASADAAAVPSRVPGPPRRPRSVPNSRPQSWEKLKNPFD
jgi:serine/threonine protein kinase